MAVKDIIIKLKNEDVSSLLEDIKALFKFTNDKVSCSEVCLVLKAMYQLISVHEETKKDDSYCSVVKVIPCINLCIDYVKKKFVLEEATKHQFLPVLYHVIRVYLKYELYCPAFDCAEHLKLLLSDKEKLLTDTKAYAKSLSALFWNEALHIEKKDNLIDFDMGFKFRSTAVDFMLLEDKYPTINQKVSLTLIRYYHNNEQRNSNEVVQFLRNVWMKLHLSENDYDHKLHIFKLIYSLFEVLVKYFKDASVLKFLSCCLTDLLGNLDVGEKCSTFRTCIEIARMSVQFYLLEKLVISEKCISDFQKIINFKKKHEHFEVDLLAHTCGFFYLSFVGNVNMLETCHEKKLSSVFSNVKVCTALVCQYLNISSIEEFQNCFPFCLKLDITISLAAVNIFSSLIKKEQDVKKKQEQIKEAQSFVLFTQDKFKCANLTSELKTALARYANAVGNIGCILYNTGLYFESTTFLEVNCEVLSEYICIDGMRDLKTALWKKKEILVYCYFLFGNHKKALQCIVSLLLTFRDKQKECMELWRKVKRAASRTDDSVTASSTISDLLSQMSTSVDIEEEVFFLMEELKVIKFERYCSEYEIIAVVKKLLNMPCTKYSHACVFLEVLTMSPSLTEKVSGILKKSVLDMCLESIDLFKEHIVEHPAHNEAKILLSIDYFCLYCLKLQQLHKVAEKETEVCLKSGSDDEETETCDIKPAFPLVTFLVEAEIIKSLELTLEIWVNISKACDDNWSQFAEVVKDWDILTVIQATAEFFSTSAYDINELKTWVLLRNVASSVENKEFELNSSISLIDLLIRFGYLDIASQLLKFIQNAPVFDNTSVSLILLELKLLLVKSNYCLQKGMFDEGLSLLRKIFQNSIFEKKLKHVKMVQMQCLMLQTNFLLVPPSAFLNVENLEYLQVRTPIASAMECATLAKGLLKVTSEKQNSESSNDYMPFKTLLLRNLLKAYLLLAEQYFQIGDPRFARCYSKEGLKVAEGHILTYWASRMLITLGKTDLLCNRPDDCLVKLNGLKYIMDEDSKTNALTLLSRACAETRKSEPLDVSDDYIIPHGTMLNLKRDIKQNFINSSHVHASPISTKSETSSRFEVKFESYSNGNMFSTFLLKLEIWALSCLHLMAEDKIKSAEAQLKKLLQRLEVMKKKNKNVLVVLSSAKLEFSMAASRCPSTYEVVLLATVLLHLSLVQFSNNDVKKSEYYLNDALKSLVKSSESEKNLFPYIYAILKYHRIVMNLKTLLGIKSNACIEYYVCPSVKSNIAFSRKMKNSEQSAASANINTPTKCPQTSIIPCNDKRKFCHAPIKKDVLPRYLKKDMEVTNNSDVLQSLIFSSSEDERLSKSPPTTTPSPQKGGHVRRKPEKLSYTLFKSKNIDLNIKSACDIWKCPNLSTPKVSKKINKSQLCQGEPRNFRQTRQKARNAAKCDTNKSRSSNSKNTKRNKKLDNKTKGEVDDPSVTINSIESCNESILDSCLNQRTSVEYNRSGSKNRLKHVVALNDELDDVFYLEDTKIVSQGKIAVNTHESLMQESSVIDDLCKDLSSVDISVDKSNTLSVEKLKEFINELENVRLLVEHNAPYPLYVDICKLLAILIMAQNKTSDKCQFKNTELAFMLSETFSSSLRQIHLSNVLYYKEKIVCDDRNSILQTLKRTNRSVNAQMNHLLSSVPKDYTVVQITALSDEDFKGTTISKHKASKLIICRYQHNTAPLVMCLDSSSAEIFNDSLFPDFENILLESTLIMKKNDDTKKWWKTRSTLDLRLKDIVKNMEDTWFGSWKGLLLSKCMNEERLKQLAKISKTLSKIAVPTDTNLLQVLLDSVPFLSREQLSSAICYLWNCNPFEEVHSKVFKSILESSLALPSTERYPLILLLDKNIQVLPWESMPLLKDVPISRMPSLSILSSKSVTMAHNSTFYRELDCTNTFYILNPSGDLKYSQEFFQSRFEKQANWKGITGRIPNSQECASAFKLYDLFVYCGHGSGRQYLGGTSIDTMKCHAATILMGCSSGRLKQLGRQLEAYGIPLTYLMNGCPCVVGNLWDVTDKDIDRFTDKLFELFVPNYCQMQNSTTNIATAVSQARNACKMRHLVGAAPIIYGIPVSAKS